MKTRYIGYVCDEGSLPEYGRSPALEFINDVSGLKYIWNYQQLCRVYGDEIILMAGIPAFDRAQYVNKKYQGWLGLYAAKQYYKLV